MKGMDIGFAKKAAISVLLALMIMVDGVGADIENEHGECHVHKVGRVCLNLPGNGSLGRIGFNGRQRGILWPGADGCEFLGAGGIYLRFMLDGENTLYLIGPDSFEPAGIGYDGRKLHEGCEGGKRFPSRGCDDDGDGSVDEDSYDGVDNDGDGLVDEDFAAAGNEMIVTRAVESSRGLVLNQCSYAWSYGHVRDFIGFTTTIEYPPDSKSAGSDIVNLDVALYVDFEIGACEDMKRGENDRFLFLDLATKEKAPGLVAVSGGASSAAFAAVVVMDSRGPDGEQLGVKGFIVRDVEGKDGLWDVRSPGVSRGDKPSGLTIIPDAKDRIDSSGGYDHGLQAEKENSAGEEYEGDFAVVHVLEAIPRLGRGERIDIEWAVVFGRTEEVLTRNARRAIETYRGLEGDQEHSCRWVVPARKAVRRESDVKLVPVWAHGKKQPAAAIILPPGLEDEEVEWLRIGGRPAELYERAEAKILLPLAPELVEREDPFEIEGQLSDGTIFTARLGRDLLRTYNADGEHPPGRLPDDSMHFFPNPFLTSLNIDIQVLKPSLQADGETGGVAEGISSVRIYDVKGRLVRTILEEEFLHPGNYQASWDGLDEYGAEVAPGVYYCKLQIGARSLTKRVILLK